MIKPRIADGFPLGFRFAAWPGKSGVDPGREGCHFVRREPLAVGRHHQFKIGRLHATEEFTHVGLAGDGGGAEVAASEDGRPRVEPEVRFLSIGAVALDAPRQDQTLRGGMRLLSAGGRLASEPRGDGERHSKRNRSRAERGVNQGEHQARRFRHRRPPKDMCRQAEIS